MTDPNKIDIEILEQIYNCSTICIFDENFSIIYSNTNFNQLTGYMENDLIGKSLLQIKHQDQSNSIYEFLTKTLKKGETWKGELQLTHRTKPLIWLDTSIKPVLSKHRKNRYIATFIDVSQRKQLIDNLKQRAHHQSLIAILGQISLNNIPIKDLLEQALSVTCGSLKEKTGLVQEISVNRESALVCTAYNASHILAGKTFLEINNNNMLEYTLHTDRPVISESINDEKRFLIPQEYTQEGITSAVSLLIGDKSQPFGIFTLLSDKPQKLNIDEIHFLQSICNILAEAINRKNMETALRHEQELSRNYLNVAEVVFIVLDTQEKILLANNHAASILGYSKDELTGINLLDVFIPEKIRKTVRNNFKKMLNNEKVPEDLLSAHGNVTPIINKQNDIRFIRWKSTPILDDQGNVNSILSAGEDITDILEHENEQKNLQKQLHQAQKVEAIGMLAGGIAHDFNNILASILGFSELALENIDNNNQKLYDYLTQIQNSGIKARDIIAQLQSINLQDETPNNPILLPTLLKGTLQMLRSALPASIDMQLNINNDAPAVNINASKFNQMIMHLLTNSRNILKGKGYIEINLFLKEVSQKTCSSCNEIISGEYVIIEINDDGPGMDRKTLTELFFNNKKNINTGLPFVSHVIHNAQGHLIITDSHLGNEVNPGTSIKILFKIAKPISLSEQRKKEDINFSNVRNKRIMIIDDENSVASYMGELFKGAGFVTSVFCDSVEALETFKSKPDDFDLIVSDQTMPVITGDILAGQMLDIRPGLPIIICTGHSDLLDEEKANRLNIQALLKKPVDSAELLHTVVKLLSRTD